ncbi:MAG: DUF3698 domain-containing protein [Staphylococcus equorum]|nr:DUF3698 domain-containing protein [Staphylococcus equorum]
MLLEHDIQEYFNEIAIPIKGLYHDVNNIDNYFGSLSIVRPPLDQRRKMQPDIIHMINESDSDKPDIVFGIGDYKTGAYRMTEDLKS